LLHQVVKILGNTTKRPHATPSRSYTLLNCSAKSSKCLEIPLNNGVTPRHSKPLQYSSQLLRQVLDIMQNAIQPAQTTPNRPNLAHDCSANAPKYSERTSKTINF
jgi:hypothetical protein